MKTPIIFSHIEQISNYLKSFEKQNGVLITTQNLFSLYGSSLLAHIPLKLTPIFVPDGESCKSLEWVNHCWEKMFTHSLTRHSLVIALGGGSIGDLAGFVAATFMRGVSLTVIPTTLLAMIDACIGGKNGINFFSKKNSIGTIYNPYLTMVDYNFLKTLAPREISNGLAEIIKYGVISGEKYFEKLEEIIPKIIKNPFLYLPEVIPFSCSIKQKIVEKDPIERNDIRIILNFGHTFAHAIETLTNFSHFSHGEAVAIGISCASHLSYALKLCTLNTVERIDELLLQAQLPINLPFIDVDQLISLMNNDKKNCSINFNLILLKGLGNCIKISNAPINIIKEILINKTKDEFLLK